MHIEIGEKRLGPATRLTYTLLKFDEKSCFVSPDTTGDAAHWVPRSTWEDWETVETSRWARFSDEEIEILRKYMDDHEQALDQKGYELPDTNREMFLEVVDESEARRKLRGRIRRLEGDRPWYIHVRIRPIKGMTLKNIQGLAKKVQALAVEEYGDICTTIGTSATTNPKYVDRYIPED